MQFATHAMQSIGSERLGLGAEAGETEVCVWWGVGGGEGAMGGGEG